MKFVEREIMNKKVLLLSSAAILAFGACTAAVFTHEHENNNFVYTRAATKTFTFDGSVGSNQFPQENTDVVVSKSVETGVSSNLETTVSYKGTDNVEKSKVFGYGVYFITNPASGDVFDTPRFHIEIGVNNATSASIVFGLLKREGSQTTAGRISCGIKLYRNSNKLDESSIGNKISDIDQAFTWEKGSTVSDIGNKVVIDAGVQGGDFDPVTDLLYIKSITVNWSC